MRIFAGKRTLTRWSGIALIAYGGFLYFVNTRIHPAKPKTVVIIQPAQNSVSAQSATTAAGRPDLPTSNPVPHIIKRSPSNVQLGEPLATPNYRGELIVINNSKRGYPILSFGRYSQVYAKSFDPTAHFHLPLNGAEYEEIFKIKRKLWLLQFAEPDEICKTPVLLGEAPKEPHSLTITITSGDTKRCLGL